MAELTLVISVEDNHQKFNWDDFKKLFEQACGGHLSKSPEFATDWKIKWSGNEPDLKDVVADAEKGRIDRWIKENCGLSLLELTAENEECLYSFVPEIKLREKKLKNVTVDEVQQLASQVDILLMTATEIEQKAVLSEMDAWSDREEILQGSLSKTTFEFGRFGRYRTAHVECTMGAGGRQGGTITIERAIEELKPKAVLVLGIAFGIDRKKQRLGDVIVAESVYPYDAQGVRKTRNIQRGTSIPCGLILSERFRTRRSGWKLDCGIRPVEVHQGTILSGEKLVDNKEFRDQLVKYCCEKAKGGEMEGSGAYAAAQGSGAEIILIKGICDWADGHKNDRAQPFAAYAAVSLAKYVLDQPDVLTQLKAVDLESPAAQEPPSPPRGSEPSPLVKLSQLMFQQTRAKISLVNKYKSLHDEFQKLESWKETVDSCYVMRTWPENDPAWQVDLPRQSFKLQNYVTKIVGELDDKEVTREIGTRRIGWQETLRQAEHAFKQAIDQKAQKKLKDSVELIQTVLRPGLSFMNDGLVNTFRELQLSQSVETLRILSNGIIFERLSSDQLSLFKESLQNLENIEERIEVLLAIHNDFQGIDNELDKIERELRSTVIDVTQVFPLYWRILGRMLQEMCREREDQWANKLRQQREDLEIAMTEQDVSKIQKSFLPLRSTVSVNFNKIDTKLKEICKNLKSSGDVLDTLLRMLPNIE